MKYLISCLAALLIVVSAKAQSAFSFGYAGSNGTAISIGSSNGFGGYSGVSVGTGFGGAYAGGYAGAGWCPPPYFGGPVQVPVAATLQQMSYGAPPMFVYPQPIAPYYPVWGGGCVTPVILPACR